MLQNPGKAIRFTETRFYAFPKPGREMTVIVRIFRGLEVELARLS